MSSTDKITEVVGIVIASVFITGLALEFLLARLLKKNYFSSEFLIINLSIASLQQLTDVLNKLLFISAFVFAQQHYSIQRLFGWGDVITTNPFAGYHLHLLVLLNYIFVLVLADFCQYWLHRFSHEVNIMWAGHITHHSNTEYNFGVALRQNALENIYTWVFFMPLAFFGIPWQMFIAAYAVSLIWQFMVHTRLVNKLGPLEYFMSTPSHHRVHHGKNPQYIDKNYGAFFIIWDKLFGTFEPEVEEVEYGILKPLQNQNPVWSNVHHHLHIIKTAAGAGSWRDRLRVIFGRPAFAPAGLKRSPAPSVVVNFTNQPEKKIYVFINYVLTAALAFMAINHFEKASDIVGYMFTVIVAVSCFSIFTALLENKRWADYAEVGRLILIAVIGLCFSFQQQLSLFGILSFSLAILFLLATWFIAQCYNRLNTSGM
ncbi:MAG: sterol desaturase [Bacteroidota bacterium]|nr:sterol desaturase [Bacteroidota bacterium]